MDTRKITTERLAQSVVAVPPLARDANRKICQTENKRLISHIEAGGVNTLLYGGNAMLYHIRLSEYAELLSMLVSSVADNTLVVPSVGPAFGMMMDQAEVLRDFDFPTVMVLPQKEIADENGIATGIRLFAEAYGKPIVLYLKHDRWLSPEIVGKLYRDGLVSWIKYAVVREDTADDKYLSEVLEQVPGGWIVSGIGEQPAIVHMRDFGVVGYTSGCVCVAPRLSMDMLHAVIAKDFEKAETIRRIFRPLEDERNRVNPIRVLHTAVSAAGIAATGPMLPMLGELPTDSMLRVRSLAAELLAANQNPK